MINYKILGIGIIVGIIFGFTLGYSYLTLRVDKLQNNILSFQEDLENIK